MDIKLQKTAEDRLSEMYKQEGIEVDTPNDEEKREAQTGTDLPGTQNEAEETENGDLPIDKDVKKEYNNIEKEAMTLGWKPDGGPKSAEEFLRAAPLYDRIKKDGRKIDELEKSINELKSLMSKQNELGYQRAISDLTEKRRDAITLGDVRAVEALDKEIRYHEQAVQANKVPEMPSLVPEAQDFIERNQEWINGSSFEAKRMQEFVLQRDKELAAYALSPDEHIKQLEKELYSKFETYFNSKEPVSNKHSGTQVESDAVPTQRVVKNKKYGFENLNKEQKSICKAFERQGIMSADEYVAELVKLGELK